MKSNKIRFATSALVLLFAFLLNICTVFAGGNSVTVKYTLQGVGFDIYKVAEIDANGDFVANSTFSRYSVSLTDSNAPQTLATYATRDKVTPLATATTGGDSKAVFTGLDKGVYLITGETTQKNSTKYTVSPALVAVYDEDIEVSVKYEMRGVSSSSGGGGGGGSSSGSSETTTVSVSVLKVWKGAEEDEKTPVTVQLLKDGEVYSEAILKSSNNWRYTWKNLNRANTWTVAEKQVPDGYDVSIEENGKVFVITNTNKNYVETTTAKSSETTTEATTAAPLTEVTTAVSNDGNPNEDGNFDSSSGGNGSSENNKTDSDNTAITNEDSVPDDESMWGDDDRYRIGRNPNARDGEDGDDSSTDKSKVSSKNNGKLPQTGQLWWPVPLLAIFGDLFLIIGEDKRRKNREE
jgi:hypothetical protein